MDTRTYKRDLANNAEQKLTDFVRAHPCYLLNSIDTCVEKKLKKISTCDRVIEDWRAPRRSLLSVCLDVLRCQSSIFYSMIAKHSKCQVTVTDKKIVKSHPKVAKRSILFFEDLFEFTKSRNLSIQIKMPHTCVKELLQVCFLHLV